MIRIVSINIIVVILLYVFSFEISAFKIIQKYAMVREVDENYISEAKILTARSKRGDSYKTNITFSPLYPMNDNTTFTLSYGVKNGQKINVEYKVCTALKYDWVRTFLNEYLEGEKITGCPVAARPYKIINMDLPPKNFPLPIFRGTYTAEVMYMQTKNRKIIVSYEMTLQVL